MDKNMLLNLWRTTKGFAKIVKLSDTTEIYADDFMLSGEHITLICRKNKIAKTLMSNVQTIMENKNN